MTVARRRRSVRLRLTLLYGGLFFVSGAGLLLVTYLLVANRFPTVYRGGDGEIVRICSLPGASYSTLDECAEQAKSMVDAQRTATLTQLLTQSGVALAIMTVVSLGLGWLVAGRVLRPLRTITAAARRISANDLHERLAMTGRDDELTELADTFDGLLARLETAFNAQRQFVANASHELRTPLTRQRTVLEVALADPEPAVAPLQAACRRVIAAGAQQERLIESLLTLARGERGLDRRVPVDLRAIAERVLSARARDASATGVRLTADLGAATVHGDAHLVERLVVNLVDNAIRHNLPGGTATVVIGGTTLTVRNTGPVVPPAELERLFQPFQRLSRERTAGGAGHGLGLAIVAAIATAHDAQLDAHARPTGGLSVEAHFPGPDSGERDVAHRRRASVG